LSCTPGRHPAVEVGNDAQAATLPSGRLTVSVAKAVDWRIDYLDGDRPISESQDR
jgi:hypothetical protein